MSTLPQLPMPALREFCRKWQIQELAVFGSILREDFGPDSDVDFLVTFAPAVPWSLFDHIQMEEELEGILGRPVDMVTRRALEASENYLRREEILSTARVVHAA